MASKFGGEQAAKNHWVMQQNMARHKSVLGYVHKPKQPKLKSAIKTAPSSNDAATLDAKTEATEPTETT